MLFVIFFTGCEKKAKSKSEEIKTPFETAEELFKQDKYEESKNILLKLYNENPDHSTRICFYLFMNYGMTGDYGNAAIFLENAMSQTIIYETLKEVGDNPKYAKVFKDESIREYVDKVLKAGPPK